MKPLTKNLSIGSAGTQVYALQAALEQLKYEDFIPTGYFGEKTRAAVVKFQKANGISPAVGNVGEQTRAKLNSLLFHRSVILHAIAVSLLGVDASPADRADDEYGCADTVNMIHKAAFGFEIGGATQTAEMVKVLRSNPRFEKVDKPTAGTIIMSATVWPKIGHVGIMMDETKVMSNSSSTGLWTQNYTLESWKKRYIGQLGLKVEFFNLK